MLFVDTSAWLGFTDDRSRQYNDVRKAFEAHAGRLVTSTDIWDECISSLSKRADHATIRGFGEFLRTPRHIDLIDVTPEHREAAWSLLCQRPDKRYSLTDCTSFVIMRQLGIETAATLDDHFQQEGFKVVPRPST